MDDDNHKGNNDSKGVSALGVDRDLDFLCGHQGHQRNCPHDDEDKQNDDEEEDNNNKKDNNNDKVVESYLSSGKGYSPGVFAKSSRVLASMMTITTMTTTKMTSSRTR